jgi:hypothetical protein
MRTPDKAMSAGWWNLTVWGGWLALFCVLELLGVFSRAPWTSFSRAVWDAQARWEFLTIPVVAILAILASHLIRLKGIQEGDGLPVREQIRRDRKRARARHAVRTLAQVHGNTRRKEGAKR